MADRKVPWLRAPDFLRCLRYLLFKSGLASGCSAALVPDSVESVLPIFCLCSRPPERARRIHISMMKCAQSCSGRNYLITQGRVGENSQRFAFDYGHRFARGRGLGFRHRGIILSLRRRSHGRCRTERRPRFHATVGVSRTPRNRDTAPGNRALYFGLQLLPKSHMEWKRFILSDLIAETAEKENR